MSAKAPSRLLQLLVIVLAVLALGCEEDTVEIPIVTNCTDLVTVAPIGRLVLPVDGSQRLRVQLREKYRGRDYSHCPPLSLDVLSWSVRDPSVGRVERYSAAVVTITALAVGETWVVLEGPEVWLAKTLEVVEP